MLFCLWAPTTSLLFAATAANTHDPVSQPCPDAHRGESRGILLWSQVFIFQSKAYLPARFQRQSPLTVRSCLRASPRCHSPPCRRDRRPTGHRSAGLLLPHTSPRQRNGTVTLAARESRPRSLPGHQGSRLLRAGKGALGQFSSCCA